MKNYPTLLLMCLTAFASVFPAARAADAQTCYAPELISPARNALLPSSVTFSWTPVCGRYSNLSVSVGTTQGGKEIFHATYPVSGTSVAVTGIPGDGEGVWVRLTYLFNDGGAYVVQRSDAAFWAWTMSKISLPASGMLRNGGQLAWTRGIGVSTNWVTIPGIYDSRGQTSGPVTLTGLPLDGTMLQVRLWSKSSLTGEWFYRDEFARVDSQMQLVYGLGGRGAAGQYILGSFYGSLDVGCCAEKKAIDWPSYNIMFSGETHPSAGDLDGDGRDELVLGFARGGEGWLAVLEDRETGLGTLKWLRVPWDRYNADNGATYPAAGNLDGDGRAEIVVGLGSGANGWLFVFDDAATGYAPLGWIQSTWTGYNAANGETHPAIGDVDGDGISEIVVGLGPGGAGWIEILTGSGTSFQHQRWRQVNWHHYNTTGEGATWPAVGNLDADAAAEIAIGLGAGGQAWVEVVDDLTTGLALQTWIQAQTLGYTGHVSSRPAIGDLDSDGYNEVVIGTGVAMKTLVRAYIDIRQDFRHGFASASWRIGYGGYHYQTDRIDGSSAGLFPVIARLGYQLK